MPAASRCAFTLEATRARTHSTSSRPVGPPSSSRVLSVRPSGADAACCGEDMDVMVQPALRSRAVDTGLCGEAVAFNKGASHVSGQAGPLVFIQLMRQCELELPCDRRVFASLCPLGLRPKLMWIHGPRGRSNWRHAPGFDNAIAAAVVVPLPGALVGEQQASPVCSRGNGRMSFGPADRFDVCVIDSHKALQEVDMPGSLCARFRLWQARSDWGPRGNSPLRTRCQRQRIGALLLHSFEPNSLRENKNSAQRTGGTQAVLDERIFFD